MIVKNISAQTRLYQLGRTSIELAPDASGIVDDEVDTVTQALAWQSQGILQVTSGPVQSSLDLPASVASYRLVTLATAIQGDTVAFAGTASAGAFSVRFEFRTSGDPTAGNVAVSLGANTTAAGVNLQAAINANATLVAAGVVATSAVSKATTSSVVTVECRDADQVIASALTVTPVGGTITAATAVAALAKTSKKIAYCTKVAVSGENFVVTGLTTISDVIVQVRRAGVLVAYDGSILYNGGTVFLDDDGAADIAASDVISIFAYGV